MKYNKVASKSSVQKSKLFRLKFAKEVINNKFVSVVANSQYFEKNFKTSSP